MLSYVSGVGHVVAQHTIGTSRAWSVSITEWVCDAQQTFSVRYVMILRFLNIFVLMIGFYCSVASMIQRGCDGKRHQFLQFITLSTSSAAVSNSRTDSYALMWSLLLLILPLYRRCHLYKLLAPPQIHHLRARSADFTVLLTTLYPRHQHLINNHRALMCSCHLYRPLLIVHLLSLTTSHLWNQLP